VGVTCGGVIFSAAPETECDRDRPPPPGAAGGLSKCAEVSLPPASIANHLFCTGLNHSPEAGSKKFRLPVS
jgi:hypothetical protein